MFMYDMHMSYLVIPGNNGKEIIWAKRIEVISHFEFKVSNIKSLVSIY